MTSAAALHVIARAAAWLAAGLVATLSALAQPVADCPPAAPAHAPEQAQAGLPGARDHGFLWRISRDGRDSFLYGTVHVARPEWSVPGPGLMRALAASDTVALELALLDPDIQRRLARSLALPSPAAALPAPLQQRLQRRFEAECLPAAALASLSPEMQAITLGTLAGRRDGLDPAHGIDVSLAGWGRTANKTVVSLESPELQAALLRADSEVERIEFVQSVLEELETGRARAQLRRLTQAWAEGDLAELARYGEWCECLKTDADRAAMARLLDDRNPALADSITALHSAGQRVIRRGQPAHDRPEGPACADVAARLPGRATALNRVERGVSAAQRDLHPRVARADHHHHTARAETVGGGADLVGAGARGAELEAPGGIGEQRHVRQRARCCQHEHPRLRHRLAGGAEHGAGDQPWRRFVHTFHATMLL